MNKCDVFFVLKDGSREFITCNEKCPYYQCAVLLDPMLYDTLNSGKQYEVGYCFFKEDRMAKTFNELRYDHLANGTLNGTDVWC